MSSTLCGWAVIKEMSNYFPVGYFLHYVQSCMGRCIIHKWMRIILFESYRVNTALWINMENKLELSVQLIYYILKNNTYICWWPSNSMAYLLHIVNNRMSWKVHYYVILMVFVWFFKINFVLWVLEDNTTIHSSYMHLLKV